MDVRMYIAMAIHVGALVFLSTDPHYRPVVPWMGAFVAVSAVGMLLVCAGKAKAGAIMFIVGCVPFVPVGLIGVFGAKKVLADLSSVGEPVQGPSA
ncbi:hypothetical protein [Pseudomonas jilinensis]|uniref:Uncharacterized protein n=1 Tax=Pseudomonas jilinensis TaxID=2078689 RepID=A0A396S0J9_9PSED|nr:hypothetical protein [Pseudomonas jilinensis]RHW19501.1 hypothetical protein C2846_18500 [Pseudomonas jilinensis]